MSSKRYPDEFKIEAVKQIVEYGHSVADVASRLGTTTHSLYAWIKKFGPDSVGHAAAAAEQAEIKRLKKEVEEQEKKILEFRVAQLGEEARKQFADLEVQLADAKKKVADWVKTQPEKNEENMEKFKAMQAEIQEIEKKLSQY